MTQRYLSMKEAAQYMGLSWETLRKAVASNSDSIPPFCNLGSSTYRIVRFDIQDIDQWMDARKNRPFEIVSDKA